MSSKKESIARTEENVLHTYNRYPVVFEKGEGVRLYDTDGKSYLDFGAGIGVSALGYGCTEYNDALKAQIDSLIHTSNLYYNVPMGDAGAKLVTVSGMDKVFFTNSGTEAVEGAIKAAKKYAYQKDGKKDHEIIAMNHSFHGRSIGALSVTGNAAMREPFEPLMEGVKFADLNDIKSVRDQVTDQTCAVILEPVQGEGGLFVAEKEFLMKLRALCDERDILLIFDEIQCGMGRTGSWFAWQKFGVKPDILTSAKGLGCGFPVGAFLLNEKTAAASLAPGDHGTTYGGNPLACAAVSKVLDLFSERGIIDHVNEIAPYLTEKLDALVAEYGFITERRGMGLLQGLVLSGKNAGDVAKKALDLGLLILTSEGNVIRLAPPLVIEKEDVDEMIEKLRASLT